MKCEEASSHRTERIRFIYLSGAVGEFQRFDMSLEYFSKYYSISLLCEDLAKWTVTILSLWEKMLTSVRLSFPRTLSSSRRSS